MINNPKILIAGAGFGGVRCALDLAEKTIPGAQIRLISDKPYFEYPPSFYRLAAGGSPRQALLPLEDIFCRHKNIAFVEDAVVKVSLAEQSLRGESGRRYDFDFLVLALGSETAYFNVPGLKEFSFGFKSVREALALKSHLNSVFDHCRNQTQEEQLASANIAIVGGGPSGVELAGELAVYCGQLARARRIEPSLLNVEIIEAAPRLLPSLPEDVSYRVQKRLRERGVNIFLNRTVSKEDLREVYLKDMEMKTRTVIWTAGAKPNRLFSEIEELTLDEKGRVVIDEFLAARGCPKVFVLGDGAAGLYSGMAKTALAEGRWAAHNIEKLILGQRPDPYRPTRPVYAVPVGSGWAAVSFGEITVFGKAGWWLRRLADLKFFLSILPLSRALAVFFAA